MKLFDYDFVIMDRINYDEMKEEYYRELKYRDKVIEDYRNRLDKVRNYLLHYESYIPEDDIPEIVNMLDGE